MFRLGVFSPSKTIKDFFTLSNHPLGFSAHLKHRLIALVLDRSMKVYKVFNMLSFFAFRLHSTSAKLLL